MSSVMTKKQLPFQLSEMEILNADERALSDLSEKKQLALNLDEMKFLQQHYKKLGRNPTDVEIECIAQTWSEHCYHKTFKGEIQTENGVIKNLFKTYIAKVAEELKFPWLFLIFKDNAGVVDFTDDHAIAIKVETHNHPSAIEPFGGAATGVGGVIRDVLGVWAEPIANTDVLCFGPLDYDYGKLPKGMKHPKFVYSGVTSGVGSYGNCMGIPTVNGAIYFDEGYVGNPLVYCGCIGLLPKDKFIKNVKIGDNLIIDGNKTGRDGIHGVTFASAGLDEQSEASRPAVQIADPIQEEKLKRAILEIRDRKLASAITDVGGGGISCGAGELAESAGIGVSVFLDSVPVREKLVPWEIFVSESQERMLLVVPDEGLQEVLKIFEDEEVEATPIGKFIRDKVAKVYYKDESVGEMDLDFLFNPISITKKAQWKSQNHPEPMFAPPADLNGILIKLLSQPNIASKESVVRTYDHEVKGSTILKPLHGEFSGPNDAAVLKPLANEWKGIVISSGMNPNYGKIDPYWMAASAIDEAVRNNVAAGGRRIALLDNFCWGNPDKPDRLGGLVRAAQACYDVAKKFQTPFISGKDSLYNESVLGPVTPSLLVTALGIIPDVRNAVSTDLKKPGNIIYIVGKTYPELGGSEYYKLNGYLGNSVPKVNSGEAKKTFDAITTAIDAGYVKSCHDISEGGIAVALSEMALSSRHGAEIDLRNVPVDGASRDDFILFSESNSRFLVEVSEGDKLQFEKVMGSSTHHQIGKVIDESRVDVIGLNGQKVVYATVDSVRKAWKVTLS